MGIFDDEYMEVADLLKALAHPVRLRIITILKKGSMCVGEFEKELKLKQASVSQHLAILRNKGLIKPFRDGKRICYNLNRDRLKKVLKILS